MISRPITERNYQLGCLTQRNFQLRIGQLNYRSKEPQSAIIGLLPGRLRRPRTTTSDFRCVSTTPGDPISIEPHEVRALPLDLAEIGNSATDYRKFFTDSSSIDKCMIRRFCLLSFILVTSLTSVENLALLVDINNSSKEISILKYCVIEVMAFRDDLVKVAGFKRDEICLMTDDMEGQNGKT